MSIPTSQKDFFATCEDNQTSACFEIWEGDRPIAKDNHFLGKFLLDKIEPAPQGEMSFEVIFDISEDSILTVSAKDMKT